MAKFDREDFKNRFNEMVDASVVLDDFFEDYDEIYGLPIKVGDAMDIINGFILDINPYTQTGN